MSAILLAVPFGAHAQVTPPVTSVPQAAGSSAETAHEPAQVEPFEQPDEPMDLSGELWAIDARMGELRQDRRAESIAGPIAMVASGYGTALVSLAIALGSFTAAEDVQHWDAEDDWHGRLDANDDGTIDGDDERQFRRIARGFGLISMIGAGVGVAGSALLAKRMRARRLYDPEIRSLQRRHRELRRQLDYGANVSAGGFALSLTGRF